MSISKTVVHGGALFRRPWRGGGLVHAGGQGSPQQPALIGSSIKTLSHDPVFADEQSRLRPRSFAVLLERIRDRIIRPMGGRRSQVRG